MRQFLLYYIANLIGLNIRNLSRGVCVQIQSDTSQRNVCTSCSLYIGPIGGCARLNICQCHIKRNVHAWLSRHKQGGYWANYIKANVAKFDFDPTKEQSDSDHSEDQPMHEVSLEYLTLPDTRWVVMLPQTLTISPLLR